MTNTVNINWHDGTVREVPADVTDTLIERMRKDVQEQSKIPWYLKRYMPAIHESMRKARRND